MTAYATPEQLTDWMGEQTVPDDAGRLLERASELVDEAIVVPFDPDDETTAKALADAACAQVEWWAEVGEDADVEGQVQSAQIGNVQLGFGAGANRVAPAVVSRRTLRALRRAGLLYRGVGIR